jgi:Tol biopolymer transport system component
VITGMASGGAITDGTYRMAPDGSGFARISPLWYPNDVSRGQSPVTVLVNSGQDIYALRADGVGGAVPLMVSADRESQLRFSLDGTKIAYATVIVGPPVVYTLSVADVVRNEANEVVGMANAEVVFTGGGAISPGQLRGLDFSRDGTRIVMSVNVGGQFDLFVLTLSDGSIQRLTDTPQYEEYPRWSPVDDRIAYQLRASDGTGIGSLITYDMATGASRTVLAGGSNQYATMPCWSPDGRYLMALVGGYKKPTDLWQFPSTGGKGVNVTGGIEQTGVVPCWGW